MAECGARNRPGAARGTIRRGKRLAMPPDLRAKEVLLTARVLLSPSLCLSHPEYLVLTSGTDPHALGNRFQRRV